MKHFSSTFLFAFMVLAGIGMYFGNPSNVAWAKYAFVVFVTGAFISLSVEFAVEAVLKAIRDFREGK